MTVPDSVQDSEELPLICNQHFHSLPITSIVLACMLHPSHSAGAVSSSFKSNLARAPCFRAMNACEAYSNLFLCFSRSSCMFHFRTCWVTTVAVQTCLAALKQHRVRTTLCDLTSVSGSVEGQLWIDTSWGLHAPVHSLLLELHRKLVLSRSPSQTVITVV